MPSARQAYDTHKINSIRKLQAERPQTHALHYSLWKTYTAEAMVILRPFLQTELAQ